MKKYIPTFDEFVNEQTLEDTTKTEFPHNDGGYHLMRDIIKKHLGVDEDQIEELDSVPNFEEGKISTYSTAAKGNFVLNCGKSEDKAVCRSLDELNNITKYYIAK
jgi:hypothetical protein